MACFSSPAIVLKRLDYGEYDYILDFLSKDYGKITVIAKNAKKSRKRFPGVLELFSCMNAVFTETNAGRGKIPILKEAALTHPFAGIRGNLEKIAYASYWSEMVNRWVVQGGILKDLFPLFYYSLTMLDTDQAPVESLSLLFQVRFMTLAGMSPELFGCRYCHKLLNDITEDRFLFDVATGGLLCKTCASSSAIKSSLFISRSTIKQLLWLKEGNLQKAGRVRLTSVAKQEGLAAMEVFVPFHLAMEIKSLKVLRTIREWRRNNVRKDQRVS